MDPDEFKRRFIDTLSEEERRRMCGEGLHAFGFLYLVDGPEGGYCTPYYVNERLRLEGVSVAPMEGTSLTERLLIELRHIAADVQDRGAQAMVLVVERKCEHPVLKAFSEMGYEIRRYGTALQPERTEASVTTP
jgi:hypothetical protein